MARATAGWPGMGARGMPSHASVASVGPQCVSPSAMAMPGIACSVYMSK